MNSKITDDMVREVYKVAKRVIEKEITVAVGVRDLQTRCPQFNAGSARDTIHNIQYMYSGKSYTRTNNAFATRHFLEMLYRDYGLAVLKRAIAAVEQHIDYYAGLATGSPQPGQVLILNDFRALVDKEQQGNRGSDGLTAAQKKTLNLEEKRLQSEGTFDPTTLEDARVRTLANIVRRQGQAAFRGQLLTLYGNRCAISNCAVEPVLEAAHITPYLGPKTNHPHNGLLLRSDLHTLLDLKLIAVDADPMTVLNTSRLRRK